MSSGTDSIGFIQWPKSQRYIPPASAAKIARSLPPLVTFVAVFVNPSREEVTGLLDALPDATLQFHGEEDAEFCASFGRPWIKAAGARPGRDLLEYFSAFHGASAWLVDEYHATLYGGTGRRFDWNLVPRNPARPLILSGGLDAGNVGEAIAVVRPYAVDVSSGVEVAKGIKEIGRAHV